MTSFTLRPWAIADLENLVLYANNARVSGNMMNSFPHPYTPENGQTFIEFAAKDDPTHLFAIDVNGEAVGGIGLHPQYDIQLKNSELGYWLGEPFWNRGIMTQAVLRMIDYGFKTFEINRIFARPFGSNTASQRVLEKAGFTCEARFEKTFFKNGQYEDELIYAVRKFQP